MGTAVLEVQAIHKTYRAPFAREGTRALRGLELTVERGQAFGLIGPNGAGKTTFIKCLLGIVRPDSGSLRVLGGSPEDAAVRARIGYLPERLHLPLAWTAPAFLRSVARLKGVRLEEDGARELLDRVGLEEAALKRRIGGFSKGMKQRLGLAGALVGSPELLILDEPTDGVDPLGRVEVRKILSAELARGATLFLNSHLLAETERVCDRIGILAQGTLVREGALSELTRTGALYQLRFEVLAEDSALLALGFTRGQAPGVYTLSAKTPLVLNEALDKARAAGALLLELKPLARDLEDVLAEALGAAA